MFDPHLHSRYTYRSDLGDEDSEIFEGIKRMSFNENTRVKFLQYCIFADWAMPIYRYPRPSGMKAPIFSRIFLPKRYFASILI